MCAVDGFIAENAINRKESGRLEACLGKVVQLQNGYVWMFSKCWNLFASILKLDLLSLLKRVGLFSARISC